MYTRCKSVTLRVRLRLLCLDSGPSPPVRLPNSDHLPCSRWRKKFPHSMMLSPPCFTVIFRFFRFHFWQNWNWVLYGLLLALFPHIWQLLKCQILPPVQWIFTALWLAGFLTNVRLVWLTGLGGCVMSWKVSCCSMQLCDTLCCFARLRCIYLDLIQS